MILYFNNMFLKFHIQFNLWEVDLFLFFKDRPTGRNH